MLYITTRGNKDAYTAYRALMENSAPDGGQYIPYVMPDFDANEIESLASKTFGETVAQILCKFFSTKLTGWDVDFTIGRNAVKLVSMNHRIGIAELWHNPEGSFSYIVESLYKKICGEYPPAAAPSNWTKIAVRIAVLFGLYGEFLRSGTIDKEQLFDLSVPADDFSGVMAAWYARKFGLPIDKIICTCDENSGLWDFINRGTFVFSDENTVITTGIERLIHGTLGFDEANLFCEKYSAKRSYNADEEEQLPLINQGLYCVVTGVNRGESIVNSIYRSNNYIIDPETALCYGGVQDYRAKVGDSKLTMLLAERTPMDFAKEITSATGLTRDKILRQINLA